VLFEKFSSRFAFVTSVCCASLALSGCISAEKVARWDAERDECISQGKIPLDHPWDGRIILECVSKEVVAQWRQLTLACIQAGGEPVMGMRAINGERVKFKSCTSAAEVARRANQESLWDKNRKTLSEWNTDLGTVEVPLQQSNTVVCRRSGDKSGTEYSFQGKCPVGYYRI
jgi:hypothetical protein